MKKLKIQKGESAMAVVEECGSIFLLGSRKDVNRLY